MARSLTQVELAGLLGVTSTTVARWERGEREPTFREACRVAAALGVAVGKLAG
jgi:transcriptional regulator with XRE-family HTH domain